MFKRIELFYIASVFLLIISIILVIYTTEREQEIIKYNDNIQDASVIGAAYAINLQLQNKHRHVRLFLDEYANLFRYLERNPEDDSAMENINLRLQQRFTDFFTFTITDQKGLPILSAIETLVGDACQRDLNKFASNIKRRGGELHNEAFIHPQSNHYHYDIMAPFASVTGNTEIFFASFYLDEIVDILKTHEVPGQALILVRQTVPGLIEVTREGTRDTLTRDTNLSAAERMRISAYEDIPDTDWRLISLPDKDFEDEYIARLWKEVIIILIIVALALVVLVLTLVKFSSRRQ